MEQVDGDEENYSYVYESQRNRPKNRLAGQPEKVLQYVLQASS